MDFSLTVLATESSYIEPGFHLLQRSCSSLVSSLILTPFQAPCDTLECSALLKQIVSPHVDIRRTTLQMMRDRAEHVPIEAFQVLLNLLISPGSGTSSHKVEVGELFLII